jgi:hypothetical protein
MSAKDLRRQLRKAKAVARQRRRAARAAARLAHELGAPLLSFTPHCLERLSARLSQTAQRLYVASLCPRQLPDLATELQRRRAEFIAVLTPAGPMEPSCCGWVVRLLSTANFCEGPPMCYEDHRATPAQVQLVLAAAWQPQARLRLSPGWAGLVQDARAGPA